MIVTVNKFHHGVDMNRRPGTKTDTKRLHRILTQLGFQVTIEEENLSAEEIYKVFQEGKADVCIYILYIYRLNVIHKSPDKCKTIKIINTE